MSKFLLLLALVAGSAFGADQKISAPSGNLILDAKAGSVVKVNKTLQVDSIKNLAGTSGAPGMVPIGGMVAVMPTTHANAWQPPADCSTIKDGFMRTSTTAGAACVVPTCADCVIPAGTTLPNMYQKYTRGGGTSGTTGGANTQGLAAVNIPQVSTSYTPAGSVSGSATGGGVDHTHSGSTGEGSFSYAAVIVGQSTSLSMDWDSHLLTRGGNVVDSTPGTYNWNGRKHTHDFGTSGASVYSHTHGLSASFGGTAATITVGNASPTEVNNEPAYTEVVWIIRVK